MVSFCVSRTFIHIMAFRKPMKSIIFIVYIGISPSISSNRNIESFHVDDNFKFELSFIYVIHNENRHIQTNTPIPIKPI